MRELAMQFLDASAAEAGNFDPPMRAAVLFMVGYTYGRAEENTKGADALQAAYAIVRNMKQDERQQLGSLAPDIVIETAKMAPEQVEQALPGEDEYRDLALRFVIDHHLQRKQFDRAMELLAQMGPDSYAARDIMMALPPERRDDQARVFSLTLSAFRRSGATYDFGMVDDFPDLTVRFWQELPSELVLEAVDEVLTQTKKANRQRAIRATTTDDHLEFASTYQYRLFQFLPILDRLDPAKAESLRKENADLARVLGKYPLGQQSLDPTLRGTPLKAGEKRTVEYSVGVPAPIAATQAQGGRAINVIVDLSKSDPQQALTQANTIPEPGLRLWALVHLAEAAKNSNPEFARLAAKKAIELSGTSKSADWLAMNAVTEVLLALKDRASAQAAVEAGARAVLRVYEDDANPDNPNTFLKLYWPSAHAWRDVITQAEEVSPDVAAAIVRDIPDTQIKALAQVMLAGLWLNVPPWHGTSPMVSNTKSRRASK